MADFRAALATLVLFSLAPASAYADAALNLQSSRGGKSIPGHYIVVLKEGASTSAVAGRHAAKPVHVYSSVLNGFAAELNRAQLQRLLRDPDVKYVDEDGVVSLPDDGGVGSESVQPGAPWNLDRLDQEWGAGTDGSYNYTDTGAGVNVYVVGTGIRTTHNEFDGAALNRAKAGASGFDALGGNGQDCNGHGTHMSGTIGGTTYGVAKAVKLYSVRVLDCAGSGTTANVLAGIDWVTNNHIKPAVANGTWGGPITQSVNDAVSRSILWGVTWVVTAGASNSDACNFSPASVPAAITVGATDTNNARTSFSNWGPCVDILAPGVNIQSAYYTSDVATQIFNGTASAAAHVTGLAALYLSANKTAAPGQVNEAVLYSAVNGVITNLPAGTANRLAHKVNGTIPPPGASSCVSGGFNQEPDLFNGQCYYFSNNAGYHQIWVRGTPGTNFNVEFYRWNGSAWVKVATKATSSTNEFLKFYGTAGAYYMYLVKAASGTGTYDSWVIRPD